ncbi:hypothetical protein OC846_002903 [Tilletia horrida]|uniref:F-box domain-containing protein n=1 Tax=Tilletia horrida TaxID=155126 RepID=A0AAN6GTH5_9BASI|nr:hypothetical protein OC846_002903 [Tilletia horrida]
MAQFTPNNTFTSSSESDWAYLLGSLGWNEHIVFTKESLIDFLKTKNITVSTSFKEIKDVPQYATIGKFDRDPAAAAAASSGGSAPEAGVQSRASTGNETGATLQTGVRPLPGVVDASGKPYRSIYKVTEHAGRSAMGSIFGSEDDDQESKKKAVEQPPARPPRPDEGPSLEQQRREAAIVEVPASSQAANSGSYRPSTRVTQQSNEASTLYQLFFPLAAQTPSQAPASAPIKLACIKTSMSGHRPRLMRAPHTTPPLPTTTSLLNSKGAACWDDHQATQDGSDMFLLSSTPSQQASQTPESAHTQLPKTNHLARLPQELLIHILTFVHAAWLNPASPADPTYFLPAHQRQQQAHVALLRLTTVSAQFASAILSPQGNGLWRRLDASAVFPVPRTVSDASHGLTFGNSSGKTITHLSPTLVVALARAAGPAVTSVDLRGVQFTSGIQAAGGAAAPSLFSAAQLLQHIREAQGVPSRNLAERSGTPDPYSQHSFASRTTEAETDHGEADDDILDDIGPAALDYDAKRPYPTLAARIPSEPVHFPRTTQLTHLDLRSLQIESQQRTSARSELIQLLACSPNLVSLKLANAHERFVDDGLLDHAFPNTFPLHLSELDLSRCSGVSAEGLVRLLRKLATYQSDQVWECGDESRAKESGLKVLRIVGLRGRTHPLSQTSSDEADADLDHAAPNHDQGPAGRRRGEHWRVLDDPDSDEELAQAHGTTSERPDIGPAADHPASSARDSHQRFPSYTHPLEELMALLSATSAHCLEILDASYIDELADYHVFALTHTLPSKSRLLNYAIRHDATTSKSAPYSSATRNGDLTYLQQEQTKLSRSLASVKYFPTNRSRLAKAVEERSSATDVVLRTVFPCLRSLALSSVPRLTPATCGFLVKAVPKLETLELAGWHSRSFRDQEREAEARRRRDRDREQHRYNSQPSLPGDGPLVDLLESTPMIRRLDLEGAYEITDAVLRALTPIPSFRPNQGSAQSGPRSQPGQHLTHLIVSHAYRLSPRATLELMRAAHNLVHLELDDTRAGSDAVAREWSMLVQKRKLGERAAIRELDLHTLTHVKGKARAQDSQNSHLLGSAETPYLSLVDCRGFSKEEYDKMSRRGVVRARRAIGIHPKVKMRSADTGGRGHSRARVAAEELDEAGKTPFEWGREWFQYDGVTEIAPEAEEESETDGRETPSPPVGERDARGPSQHSPSPIAFPESPGGTSRATRLALSLPLGIGMALARRSSANADGDEATTFAGEFNHARPTSLQLPNGQRLVIKTYSESTGGNLGIIKTAAGVSSGEEGNPALGVLKSFWGWQAVDSRVKARKKRLAKEEKERERLRKANAAAAATAKSANASPDRALFRGTATRSLSFGAASTLSPQQLAQEMSGTGEAGSSTGLRNSTAAALAMILRRTGASSAGAATSAAFGPMTPPLSPEPSPTSSPPIRGVPIPGADGGRVFPVRADSGASSGALGLISPSTPGAQSTMSAFSLMALAGQRLGESDGARSTTPYRANSFGFGNSFSSSLATSPVWERGATGYSLQRHRSNFDSLNRAAGASARITTREALAFAEAAAAAGLSPTEAEILALAASSSGASFYPAKPRKLSNPEGVENPGASADKRDSKGKRPIIGSQVFGSMAPTVSSPTSYLQELSLNVEGLRQADGTADRSFPLASGSRPSSVRSLRARVRAKGDRARGRLRRLLSGRPGTSGSGFRFGSRSGAFSSLPGSRLASGTSTPQTELPSFSHPTTSLLPTTGSSPGTAARSSPSTQPQSSYLDPSERPGTSTAAQYYAPTASAGMDGLDWEAEEEFDGHGCVIA